MSNVIKSDFYGTGRFWIFNNGQYGEKIEIKMRECWQLQIIDNKVTGLYHWLENENYKRFDSRCYSVYNISTAIGKKAEAWKKLMEVFVKSMEPGDAVAEKEFFKSHPELNP